MTTTDREPLNPEQLVLHDDGAALLGSRCPQCGLSYFPRRWECAVDQTPVEDIELSRTGVLRVATYVSVPSYGKNVLDAEGYGVGEVDLPEGVRVQSVLGGEPTSWVPGTPMRLTVHPVDELEDGRLLVTHQFAPKQG
ncbi:Zn-ribbon domain-containing OB-fold protein [Nocardioides marmoriginsengisoli]|nr:hypothetical protein [Nocardioides marmoriginsengisoli]